MKHVEVTLNVVGARVIKHRQITGNLKVSTSKKRKHHQQMIKNVIESVLDAQTQTALGKENAHLARLLRAAHFKAKQANYGLLGLAVDARLAFRATL